MASIKVKFRPSAVADREGTIYYQVIHQRKVRQLLSAYRVLPGEWNEKASRVADSRDGERRVMVMSVREHVRSDVERLRRIVRKLEQTEADYTADDVIDEFHRYISRSSLFNFMEGVIVQLRETGRTRTSEAYRAALNSFKKFVNGKDMMLDSLTANVMLSYEAWHHQRGVIPNTISFYNRILRAVYNRAVEQEIIEDRHPFRLAYTGIDKTVKRALPLNSLKAIKGLDLAGHPSLDYARDMFMLSFYLRGMSFIDMAFLRKTDLRDGYVVYRRRKTGQRLTISWTKEMQGVLDKYPANPTGYLLPIIKTHSSNERCTYRNAGYLINRNLKKIGAMARVSIPLTLYVARHSWASVARAKGIPVSVISEGMGHDSEMTTQIYLASLDTSAVDRANAVVIRSV